MDKPYAIFLLLGLLLFMVASTFLFSMNWLNSVYGFNDGIVLKDPASFYDSSGKLNIVGVVDNNGEFPVDVTVGVNVTRTPLSDSITLAGGSSNALAIHYFLQLPTLHILG